MRAKSVSPNDHARRALRCRRIAGLGGVILAAYWIATLANVSQGLLNLAFTVVIVLLLPVAWWAVFAAPPQLKRFVGLGVGALTSQAIGSGLWYAAYLNRGGKTLPGLGYWSPLLYLALLLAAGASWTAVRGILVLRDVMLDFSVVVAAAASVAFAVIEPHLNTAGWSPSTVDALIRPLLSLLIVVLIASAILGRWQSLPLSVSLVGLSLLVDAAGLLCASYFESRGVYTSDRWPDLLWCTAAVIVLFAALTIIGGVDRPLRLSRKALPGVSPLSLVLTTTGAWTVAGAVVVNGLLTHNTAALIGGAAGVAWIAVAAMLRTTAALHEIRTAYHCLDEAHFSLEKARERAVELVDERDAVIAQLEARNIELRAVQTMLGPVLDLADERTNGQLRSNLEDAADDLTAWLPLTPRPGPNSAR